MRKVLLIFTEVFANGGIQRFNRTLLDACGGLGISCFVLSLNDSPEAVSAHAHDHRHHVVGFAGNRARFAAGVARHLLLGRYDRVLIGHINFLTLCAGMFALRPLRSGTVMLVAHGIEVWNGIGARRARALRTVDRILCVSRYTRQRIDEQAPGLGERRFVIFPNALADSWRHSVPVASVRLLPQRFILSVTRLEPGDRYKGVATVIEAFSMLPDAQLHYLVVGQGRDADFLRAMAARLGVADRVHFVSGVKDAELIGLYRTCEAFVLPSGKEGFGIVFLEAMFFGAPVIAAREKGAIDVVRDGETGIAVPFGDVIAIKRAIERLAADSELRERLRATGRSLVTADGPFTFASFVRRCAAQFGPEVAA